VNGTKKQVVCKNSKGMVNDKKAGYRVGKKIGCFEVLPSKQPIKIRCK
jgi:hypothetical protein